MSSGDRFGRRLAELGHVRRGETMLLNGENEPALAQLAQAAAVRESPATLDLVARCQHRLGRLDAAIASFERIVADPERAGRHLFAAERGLLYALRDAGRGGEADRVAERLAARYACDSLSVSRSMLESDSRLPYHRWRDFLEKDRLAHELAAWRARHADSAAFWPESFALPADQDSFERFRAISPPDQIFIVKPSAGSGGKGIVVTREPRPASRPVVIQRYLDRPYLVDGHKCHVRLHLLVATHGAPRAYLQRDGIVRIAPEPYATDDAALRRNAAQVTNTGLHRFHRDMRIASSDADSVGNVWRLSGLLRHLAEDGLDAGQIHRGMIDLARRLVGIIVESGLFRAQAEEHGPYCFPPLAIGLDLLLDAAGRSWLLECQRSPSLIGGALVDGIVGALGAGAFSLALDDGSGDVAAAGFDRLL